MAVIDGRTGLEMISTPECWRLLEQHDIARLGVSVGGKPEIMPVNYAVGEGRIVFRTDAGTKYRALQDFPSVVLEVDGFDAPARTGWSVQVKGRAEVVHDPATLRRLRATPPAPWAPGDKSIWVHVVPTEVTGRRIAPPATPGTAAIPTTPTPPTTGGTMHTTTEDPVLLESFVLSGLPWEPLPAIGEGVEHQVLWRSGDSMAGLMRLAPGGAVSAHAHRAAHHHLWVVDGALEVLGEVLGPSSYVHIPAQVRHALVNRARGPSTFLYLYLQPR